MKLYKLLVFIIGVSFASCEYDYDVDLGEFTSKVVVNSVINPDSIVKATLFWSKHIDDTSSYKVVDRFTAKLYENNNVIFDGDGIDGVLTTTIYPKEGAKYHLEVDVPQYGKLSAETSIPLKPTFDVNYVGTVMGWMMSYVYFTINEIVPNSETRSVMIKALSILDTTKSGSYVSNFYVNNAFCDQFNTVNDMTEVQYKGSSVGYVHYIRVPYKNINQVTPLTFSLERYQFRGNLIIIGYEERPAYDPNTGNIEYKEYPIYNITYTMLTEVIAPSNEYDKYYKSAYQQNEDVSIFSDTYSVHSNIENGLGIFAGYSSASTIITF